MIAILDLVKIALTYGLAHIIVLCIYRTTFHPYAKYPGPFLGKFSNLRGAYFAYYGNIHIDVERCHEKYGNFVRYGPNQLLVNSPTGFHDIYDNLKKVKKAQTYKVHGDGNLIGIQDKAEYARNKKIFQQGFSDNAIREHEPKVIEEVNTFIDLMSKNESTETSTDGWTNPKNMALWCMWFTTDIISKVVFTTSWDLMTSTTNRGLTECFKTVVRLVGVIHYWPIFPFSIGPIIFLPHLVSSIPALMRYTKAVMASSKVAREEDPSIKDVFGFFSSVKDPNTDELALTADSVRRNSANFIIAGSDTTASSIAATFFYLSHDPTAYAKVAQEIRSAFPSASTIRAGPTLNNLPYLRAAINESLRMSPVAPQPLWRETESGFVVDSHPIPAGLKVASTIFSLHHDAAIFPDPYKYDISRWIIDPSKDEEEEKERLKQMNRSWAPFSVGPRQCIAKNFAMMELLLTMANVFYRLDFERVGKLGEGGKGMGRGREREGEFQMRSYFTAYMEGPMVRFKVREFES